MKCLHGRGHARPEERGLRREPPKTKTVFAGEEANRPDAEEKIELKKDELRGNMKKAP